MWKEVYRDDQVRVDVDTTAVKRSPGLGTVVLRWTWAQPQRVRGLEYHGSTEVVEYDSERRMTRLTAVTLMDAAGVALPINPLRLDQRWGPVIADSIGAALAQAICPLLALDAAAFKSSYKGLTSHDPSWSYYPARAPARSAAVVTPLAATDAVETHRARPPHFVLVSLLSLLCHALVWLVLGWGYVLVGAGYLVDRGRALGGENYRILVESSIQFAPLIGILYGTLSYLIMLTCWRANLKKGIGLKQLAIAKNETRAFNITVLLGAAFGAVLGAWLAGRYATDLRVEAVLLGMLVGTLASVGNVWSIDLVRRPLLDLGHQCIHLVVLAMVCWLRVSAVLSKLDRGPQLSMWDGLLDLPGLGALVCFGYLVIHYPVISPRQRTLERAHGIVRCKVCDQPITPSERARGRNAELCRDHRLDGTARGTS